MLNIYFAGKPVDWPSYQIALNASFEQLGLSVDLSDTVIDPARVDYIIYAPNGPLTDFTPFTNVKLVQNLWAGVEVPSANKTLTQPLARMVEPGLTLGMADYVMGHVLRHHLGTDFFAQANAGQWDETRVPPLAQDRKVGILGLGALGLFCAHKISDFGFQVCGWSRGQKSDDRIGCFSGAYGLKTLMAESEILVMLLPNTPETTGIINSETIRSMRDGVAIINPGRGPLIDDNALLAGLDSGKISGATLDVFHIEPLPTNHPFWGHPKVLVTPHIASATRIETACDVVAQNIARGESGQPFLHMVDKTAGY